jgi:hypothetical protein
MEDQTAMSSRSKLKVKTLKLLDSQRFTLKMQERTAEFGSGREKMIMAGLRTIQPVGL